MMGIGTPGRPRGDARRGSALLIAIVATIVLAGMAGAVMAVSGAFKRESMAAIDDARALYVAEAGVAEGIASLQLGAPADFGTPVPLAFGDGQYWGTVVDNGDDTATVTSFGTVSGQTRGVEAVLGAVTEPLYTTALFAGNSSGDPLYDMDFGGKGKQADEINGDIYSGGNVAIAGDAKVNGKITANGSIAGGSGGSAKWSPPDLAAMDYANTADFDVAGLFAGGASYKSSALGGSAWQMPEDSPAHIFRKDPSDRKGDWSATSKDDYFLEDPYEKLSTSATTHASAGSQITISGVHNKPGPNGNEKVYYIDGNLWVHNRNGYSFTLFNQGPENVRITIVVKGNIYFSDNVFYHDPKDGLAFIAMKDEKEPDSGNIYFGDPTFGTLEQMDAFMYAENDFYDNNLDASGSAEVTVNGNMTAGNQVLINRDYGSQHSKLTVNFDGRLADGSLTLPGLPGMAAGGVTWSVLSWREIAAP